MKFNLRAILVIFIGFHVHADDDLKQVEQWASEVYESCQAAADFEVCLKNYSIGCELIYLCDVPLTHCRHETKNGITVIFNNHPGSETWLYGVSKR